MIDLDAKKMVSAVKIIDLDPKLAAEKTMVAHIFEINGGSIHTKIVLINQNTTILLQIVILGFEI